MLQRQTVSWTRQLMRNSVTRRAIDCCKSHRQQQTIPNSNKRTFFEIFGLHLALPIEVTQFLHFAMLPFSFRFGCD